MPRIATEQTVSHIGVGVGIGIEGFGQFGQTSKLLPRSR